MFFPTIVLIEPKFWSRYELTGNLIRSLPFTPPYHWKLSGPNEIFSDLLYRSLKILSGPNQNFNHLLYLNFKNWIDRIKIHVYREFGYFRCVIIQFNSIHYFFNTRKSKFMCKWNSKINRFITRRAETLATIFFSIWSCIRSTQQQSCHVSILLFRVRWMH